MQAGGGLTTVDDLKSANRFDSEAPVSVILDLHRIHGCDNAVVIRKEAMREIANCRSKSRVHALSATKPEKRSHVQFEQSCTVFLVDIRKQRAWYGSEISLIIGAA